MRSWLLASFLIVAVGIIAGEKAALTPADISIREYLARQAVALEADFLKDVKRAAEFEQKRAGWREEYFEMLGLSPLPERTPLNATITGKLELPGFVVEKLHYQSRPGLYVTANLYLPHPPAKEKLPAILYQCGHSNMKRDGNKAAYQDQGAWFATHGYVCLVIDTLQLGELASFHHGTYREGRWWWHSAGYTPAGVECWNAMRGIDYLQSRPEVDGERIGATGISGGGAGTFWIAAADERVKAAAPCAAMADLQYYCGEDGVNGHCDCMFIYNRARWNWTQIAALICPRPLLFTNSDNDAIFPMSANERVINRLEWLYARFGASDKVDAVVSVGGHAYRSDLRRSIFEFFNRTLKQDARPVLDPDAALVEPDSPTTTSSTRKLRIEPEKLRVFPTDADIPKDAINVRIDETFVPRAEVALPQTGGYEDWQKGLLAKLKRASFNAWPETPPEMRLVVANPKASSSGSERTEDGILAHSKWLPGKQLDKAILIVLNPEEDLTQVPTWAEKLVGESSVFLLMPRGGGPTAWTKKNPPNTVERALPLLGATVDSGRVWDIKRFAEHRSEAFPKFIAAGKGSAGILAAYAALYAPNIAEVIVVDPPVSHYPKDGATTYAPAFLNVLRVLDVPDALGALAPRPLTIIGAKAEAFSKTGLIYKAAGAEGRLKLQN